MSTQMTPLKALLALPCAVAMVAGYIGIATFLRLQPVFAGLVFSLIWGAIYHASFDVIGQVLGGSLTGIGLAYLYQTAPAVLPHYGLALALVVILCAVYCLLLGWLPLLINNTAMLFLTLCTIPQIQAQNNLPQVALAVLLAAIYFGGLIYLLTRRRRAVAV